MMPLRSSSANRGILKSLKEANRPLTRAILIRSISTTTSCYASRPMPKPMRRKVKSVNQFQPDGTSERANGLSGSKDLSVDEQLPPIDLLKSAKKSGALNIEPEAALSALRRYIELSHIKQRNWERQLCAEEKITPETLTVLALILGKCQEKPRKVLGQSLITTASTLGDPQATIFLLESGLRHGHLARPELAAPLKELESLAAAPTSNPKAMVLLGRIYESQKREDDALELFRRAASSSSSKASPSNDISQALIRQGRILQRRFDSAGAEAAFRQAALECDDPEGYYRLAQLQGPESANREVYLLKAASSGILEACHEVGTLQLGKAQQGQMAAKEKTEAVGMGKEWLFLAANAGVAESMLSLAEVFRAEGKLEMGVRWLRLAEEAKDVSMAAKAKELRSRWLADAV